MRAWCCPVPCAMLCYAMLCFAVLSTTRGLRTCSRLVVAKAIKKMALHARTRLAHCSTSRSFPATSLARWKILTHSRDDAKTVFDQQGDLGEVQQWILDSTI